MHVEDGAIEILQQYANNLIALGKRFMTENPDGDRYLDVTKIKNNKNKRRVLMMWAGEMIDAVLDDLRDSENKNVDFQEALKKMDGLHLNGETDFATISLGNILAFEILDLLNDQIDETDASLGQLPEKVATIS